MAEKIITVDSQEQLAELFGQLDGNITRIQKEYNVNIVSRDGVIKIIGEEKNISEAEKAVKILIRMSGRGQTLSEHTVRYVTSMVTDGVSEQLEELKGDGICLTSSGKILRARTVGQKRYVDMIKDNTIVLGIGPAGTGKTYLAVAMAVKAFREHKVHKIILTRPAVEAGEKLGFLPGDMQDKVDPYLRPLYDALFDMFGAESFARYMEKGIIEVAPLAYMRGRTLDEAFIILDEAQNTTSEQIKMFLTRLGNESRMVITGDITQIDLPDARKSGLVEAVKILHGIDDIAIHRFTEKDQPCGNGAVGFISSVHFLNEGINYREVYTIFFIGHIMPSHFFFFERLQSCKYWLDDIPIAFITRQTVPFCSEVDLRTKTGMLRCKVIVFHGKTNIPANCLSCDYDVTNISALGIGILIDREDNNIIFSVTFKDKRFG